MSKPRSFAVLAHLHALCNGQTVTAILLYQGPHKFSTLFFRDAREETRTLTGATYWNLNPARLPIPPLSRYYFTF